MEINKSKYGVFIESLMQEMEDPQQWDKLKAYLLMEQLAP
jgi:hypothetical protein